MPYPVKMRERALQALKNGHTKAEVREMYGLGVNTLRDWELLEAETGSLETRPQNRTAYKIDREKLIEYYRNNPYSTNKETAIAFTCSVSGIRSAKKALGITRKKTQSNMPNAMSKSVKSSSLRQRLFPKTASCITSMRAVLTNIIRANMDMLRAGKK